MRKHLIPMEGHGLDLNNTELLIDFWKKYGKNILRGLALTGATAGVLSSSGEKSKKYQQMRGGGFREWWQKNKNYVYATGAGALALYGAYKGSSPQFDRERPYYLDAMITTQPYDSPPVLGYGFTQTGKEKMRRGAKYIKENAKYIAPVGVAMAGLLYFLMNKGFPPTVANKIVNQHLEPEHIEHAVDVVKNPYAVYLAQSMALGKSGKGMSSIKMKHNII